jgi:hypothetical protein
MLLFRTEISNEYSIRPWVEGIFTGLTVKSAVAVRTPKSGNSLFIILIYGIVYLRISTKGL